MGVWLLSWLENEQTLNVCVPNQIIKCDLFCFAFYSIQQHLYQKSSRVGQIPDSSCDWEMFVFEELIIFFPLFFQGGLSVGLKKKFIGSTVLRAEQGFWFLSAILLPCIARSVFPHASQLIFPQQELISVSWQCCAQIFFLLIPVLGGRGRQISVVSGLVYRESSRATRTLQRNSDLKTNTKQQQ